MREALNQITENSNPHESLQSAARSAVEIFQAEGVEADVLEAVLRSLNELVAEKGPSQASQRIDLAITEFKKTGQALNMSFVFRAAELLHEVRPDASFGQAVAVVKQQLKVIAKVADLPLFKPAFQDYEERTVGQEFNNQEYKRTATKASGDKALRQPTWHSGLERRAPKEYEEE